MAKKPTALARARAENDRLKQVIRQLEIDKRTFANRLESIENHAKAILSNGQYYVVGTNRVFGEVDLGEI